VTLGLLGISVAASICMVAAGCRGEQAGDRRPSRTNLDSTPGHVVARGAGLQEAPARSGLILGPNGLTGVALCSPLTAVSVAFPGSVDTSVESENERWPGKTLSLPTGGVLFESSWADTSRVWRITVSSPSIRTPGGYRVGTTLRALLDAGERVSVHEDEGYLTLDLDRERLGATLDSASEAYVNSQPVSQEAPSVSGIPSSAKLATLIAKANCTRGSQ
jgi:hypothetical protein